MGEIDPPLPFYPGIDLDITIQPGFPAVHEAYRTLRDQKDMVCGAYTLAYLLHAYGITEFEGELITVDEVAAAAGTALEPHNAERLDRLRQRIRDGAVPEERAETWYPHDYYAPSLPTVDDSGGTSPRGIVKACENLSTGLLSALPIPAVHEGTTQLTTDVFDQLLAGCLSDNAITAQVILNYNLSQTLAPASLLGHKYNLTALFTQWNDPEYFRRLDWDVGHFTTLAGRLTRSGSDVRYLVIRDSYKTFGWNGYHLQPENAIRDGLIRADDHRNGGLLLVVPEVDRNAVEDWLTDLGLTTGIWDNGSAYFPEPNASPAPTERS